MISTTFSGGGPHFSKEKHDLYLGTFKIIQGHSSPLSGECGSCRIKKSCQKFT